MQQKEIVILWQRGRHYVEKKFQDLQTYFMPLPMLMGKFRLCCFYTSEFRLSYFYTSGGLFADFSSCCAVAPGPVAATSVDSDNIATLFLLLFIMFLLV